MSEKQSIRLAISTCPNDTFAFHGLLNQQVDQRGLQFDISLLDIEQLNRGAIAGQFDVAKVSFHAALRMCDTHVVLPSGSALGFGVGPLLLASRADVRPQPLSEQSAVQRVLCPGELTTATLLYKLFYPDCGSLEQVVFSEIMPRLMDGSAELGVCIHEGRFTWQQHGLSLVEDLGTRWERETNCPLPLGGIVAKKSLGDETLAAIQAVVSDSISLALAEPETALPSMRRYAQEFDDQVLMKHVELYVNQWTQQLGVVGQRALDELSRRALQCGLVADQRRLQIW